MHRNPVGPGIGESRNVVIGILDHQMTVKRNVHGFTQRRNHRRPDRDIGHKMAVHDIHMEQGGAPSPTLKRANRRTERFSPSLPTTVAISWCTVMVWSLMKGCSYRQTSS